MDLNNNHPDDAILEDARMSADNDWEENFIASLLDRRKRMAEAFSLSDREREIVLRIGGNQ